MRFSVITLNYKPQDVPHLARSAEAMGFDGFWIGETNADPFIAMTLAAEHTSTISIGTSIALAFPRSPTVLAHLGHDLTRLSNGRFVLGLGTQVRGHIERRFGIKWERPVERLREYILAIRTVWDAWQTGTRLNFKGEFFTLDLMAPFFSPRAHPFARTPIYISCVNPRMLRLCGELADGAVLHAFHTVDYLRQIALPNLHIGLDRSGRTRADLKISTAIFAIPTDDPDFAAKAETYVRGQIAFYMSTPAYKIVTDLHGWGDLQYRLSRYARIGAWTEMANALPDEVVHEMTVRGTWADLPGKIAAKYGDTIDDLSYYLPFNPGEADDGWKATIAGFRALTSS